MRASLIAQLDERIDGGTLALLGSVQLALDAVDAVGEALEREPAGFDVGEAGPVIRVDQDD